MWCCGFVNKIFSCLLGINGKVFLSDIFFRKFFCCFWSDNYYTHFSPFHTLYICVCVLLMCTNFSTSCDSPTTSVSKIEHPRINHFFQLRANPTLTKISDPFQKCVFCVQNNKNVQYLISSLTTMECLILINIIYCDSNNGSTKEN